MIIFNGILSDQNKNADLSFNLWKIWKERKFGKKL
jgi:hypothetical protein